MKKKDKKEDNSKKQLLEKSTLGITLVALVVTIVVLLILAGITITYIMGDNSVFKQALEAKLKTELAKIEERAGLIYSDKLLEKVSSNSNDKPTMQEIVEELTNQGDKIEEIAVDGDGITGISLDRETMTLGFGGTNKIKVTLERSDTSSKYYAVVDGKYYEMHFNGGVVTIDRKPSEVSSEGTKQKLNMSNSDDTVATATLDESTNTITVTATNKAGTTKVTVTYGSYTKECIITVRDIPITMAMELNSVRARIAAGYTRWLTAITTPTNALQEFDWSSSDTSIATVDNKGVITAKKAGTTTITAKTIDGSNKEGSCEVTVVENAVDVATLTEIQTGEKNIIAKDSNGNLITVPIGFKVLTSEGTKVTDGIVISDETGDGNGNEFVWVPVDSVSTETTKPADDIRLGRYTFDTTNGTPKKQQDATDYAQVVNISCNGAIYQELVDTEVKKIEEFVARTLENGGYYIARYEASKGTENKPMSKKDKAPWVYITQEDAAKYSRDRYKENSYVQSSLLNSYGWDSAVIFIQKYSGYTNYANKTSKNSSILNTGMSEDKVCNIFDIASNCWERSTEEVDKGLPCGGRGGCYAYSYCTPGNRSRNASTKGVDYMSFRLCLYLK